MLLQALLLTLIEKGWLRWLAAVLVIAIGTFAIMPPQEREIVATKAVSFIGYGSSASSEVRWERHGRLWPFEKPALARSPSHEDRL
jgi:hypothetical protein